ncbi:hypothetical protein B0H11DRAFT_2386303 [Mycena galericulata]|nr:hypothetical protein B0H11DRAFT_2386303 [Mycena galericulata]
MDFEFRYPDGSRPKSLWSIRDGVEWCSVGDLPGRVPPKINDTINVEEHAFIYDPANHWWGWAPTNSLPSLGHTSEDIVGFVFERNEVELSEEYVDIMTSGGSDDEGYGHTLAGYFIADWWRTNTVHLSRRLHDISSTLAVHSDFYGPNAWTTKLGDMPEQVDDSLLDKLQYLSKEAQTLATRARHIIMGQLAFLSWFMAILSDWESVLDHDDGRFLKSLRLPERRKRGYIVYLSRDYHEVNLGFWTRNGIPFHYPWTDREKALGRLVRYSPRYSAEIGVLIDKYPSSNIDLSALPSYAEWKESLERYDEFFQDLFSGRMGEVINEFKPDWEYRIVDFMHYGARPIDNPYQRRAYSERFKGTIRRGAFGKVICTFFRQNPLGTDEPPSARGNGLDYHHPLSHFGIITARTKDVGMQALYEDTEQVREQVKNRWAPRGKDRTFNTYNGMRSDHPSIESSGTPLTLRERLEDTDIRRARSPMSPTRRSDRTSDLGLSSRWAQSMAGPSRRRSSRSLSPREKSSSAKNKGRRVSRSLSSERSYANSSQVSFEDEYQSIEEGELRNNSSTPEVAVPMEEAEEDNTPADVEDKAVVFQTRDEAVDAIREWASVLTTFAPPKTAPITWYWNTDWLRKSILVVKEERSALRMKTWAACLDFHDFAEVLNMAILYGVPFQLFVPQSQVRQVGVSLELPSLLRSTLEALYSPGYVEQTLSYGLGGVTLYARYLGIINALLKRPHAIAFIFAGGILSYLAQLYDDDLVDRLREGPSPQVVHYQSGEILLRSETFYTTDRVSEGEILLLLGHVSTGNPSTDTYLWPHPSLLEEECHHAQGEWSPRFFQFLENLRKMNIEKKRYRWRTMREWRAYIRAGNKGDYAASHVLTDEDVSQGRQLLHDAFPVEWNEKPIDDIVLPEIFEPSIRT